MASIYILRLKNDRYYVGRSVLPHDRILQHFSGVTTASVWTKIYPPEEVLAIHPITSPFDEDKYVKEMMYLHGIEKVRGGSYSDVNLDENTIKFLLREIRGATDGCFRCGSTKHFVSACPREKERKERKEPSVKREDIICYICHKPGHIAPICPHRLPNASKKKLSMKKKGSKSITCYRCYQKGHLSSTCPTLKEK